MLAVGCTGCVPSAKGHVARGEASAALAPLHDAPLAQVFGVHAAGAPSWFAPIDGGDDGLDVRLALAATAVQSIDAQSYLWHEDPSGSLLLERLLEAADRGVRVRLLIDGFLLEGHEELDAALDLHPNLELRVFNPTLHRAGLLEGLEMVEHLGELDHRMHNKLFLVDGVVGVFGGRNVGDEYFGLGDELDFRDFDLLAAGPVLPELAESFDEFWNGEWTVPLASFVHLDAARALATRASRGGRRTPRAARRRVRSRAAPQWLLHSDATQSG